MTTTQLESSAKAPRKSKKPRASAESIVAIDGEGVGRFPHRYVYLAACDEHGELVSDCRDERGLPTYRCLDWLLSLGTKRVFGYALGYDLAKMLQDIPAEDLYRLARPELRKTRGSRHPAPIRWMGFALNYVRGRLTVRRVRWDDACRCYLDEGPSVVVWDVFRFFGSKFTSALLDWKVATKERLREMEAMKDARADFAEMWRVDSGRVVAYCQEECAYMARLVRELISAHEAVDLELVGFYGAGSTAAALLTKLGVKTYLVEPPPEMIDALARGFFGGRFECSHVGPVTGDLWNYDISSAYPYQTAFLPCLTCGTWEYVPGPALTRSALLGARLALVHARVHAPRRPDRTAWGPLPWRGSEGKEKGTICFPARCGGTWVWRDEFLAAEEVHAHDGAGVEALGAWLYRTTCDCAPFAEVPGYYRERVRIGKEGRGIVIKLGLNSIYGKTAQSVGSPQFQSWVYAGCITSGCRAQLLRTLVGLSETERWGVLSFATDGVKTRHRLRLPAPRYTATEECRKENGTPIPLGGWEETLIPGGEFLIRPGISLPLRAAGVAQGGEAWEALLKETKARGMAKRKLLEHAGAVVEHWRRTRGECDAGEACRHTDAEAPGCGFLRVRGITRFVGMVSGVQIGEGGAIKRRESFGEWVDHPVDVSFRADPKRRGRLVEDHSARVGGAAERLELWHDKPGESAPYDRAVLSEEALLLREAEILAGEQADGDFGGDEFGTGGGLWE